MKAKKRQTYYLDGGTYMYRITASAMRKYEESSGRKITNALPLREVVRSLYFTTLMLPAGYDEGRLVQLYRKGLLRTRQSRGEYSVRGMRSLLVHARKELLGKVTQE